MLRLALGNAPKQACSRRALSSSITRNSAHWTRGRRYNSTKPGAGANKKGEKLSSDKAVHVDSPSKPTVSTPDVNNPGTKSPSQAAASASLESTAKTTSNSSTPTSAPAAEEVTVVENKATPTSKVIGSKGLKETSTTASNSPATGPAASDPVSIAKGATASVEAAVTSPAKVETTVDTTGQASSRVEASSAVPVSDIPPTQAEELLEAAAVELPQTKDDPVVKSKKAKVVEEVEEYDEDEDFDFANIDTSVEEATVKLLQSEEFVETLQSGSEPQGPLETPDFGGFASTPEQTSTARLRTREELGDNFTEAEWHSAIVHGRGVHLPFRHPRTHSVPVALIHFRSHSPEQLALFTHFAQHAAASLGIPCSGVASLPTKRTLWTVIKGPFAHKKTQENFERRVHKRAIKAWDANPEVVDLWTAYLRRHAMGGVGMRVVKWTRAPVGVGQQVMERVRKRMGKEDKVRKMGEQIIQAEMRKDMPAVEQ